MESHHRRRDGPADFQWQCPLLSLPLAFGTELCTIPATIPYVHPEPALVAGMAAAAAREFAARRAGLGRDPKHLNDAPAFHPVRTARAVDQPCRHNLLLVADGAARAARVKQLGSRVRLIDLQAEQRDFADTAAIVANLDLVISIDTSVAHLAGAMGKPVWVLLHKSPDWRWMLDREDSPWYPTARLFRQSTLGNWQDVVDPRRAGTAGARRQVCRRSRGRAEGGRCEFGGV